MKKTLVWLLNAAIFAGVGALGYRAFSHVGADHADKEQPHAPAAGSAHADEDDKKQDAGAHKEQQEGKTDADGEEAASHVSRSPGGDAVVTFDKEMQEHVGIKVAALTATSWRPETAACGVLQEDPSRCFALRAPVTGILHGPASGEWPALGAILNDGATVGAIEPKLTPVEQVDLASRLVQARAEVSAAEAALAAAQASYRSKIELNKQNKIVAERTIEEAQAKVKGEQARLDAAREIVSLIEASRKSVVGPTGPMSLRLAQGGEVVECACRVGEMVDAGQVLLRVARYDRLLARVDLPVGEPIDATATQARIATIEQPDTFMPGRRVMFTTGGMRNRVMLFEIDSAGLALRPGTAVTAYILSGGEAKSGVLVPRSAVVRMQGRTWTYVQTSDTAFTRREMDATRPTDDGWFCAAGFKPGERVVVDGTVALVSEELKPQIELEESGE